MRGRGPCGLPETSGWSVVVVLFVVGRSGNAPNPRKLAGFSISENPTFPTDSFSVSLGLLPFQLAGMDPYPEPVHGLVQFRRPSACRERAACAPGLQDPVGANALRSAPGYRPHPVEGEGRPVAVAAWREAKHLEHPRCGTAHELVPVGADTCGHQVQGVRPVRRGDLEADLERIAGAAGAVIAVPRWKVSLR
jgi:hypothetical protein